MNRRALLQLAPAALAATAATAATAAPAVVDPAETPVMRLFREWETVSKACDTAGREPETPENDAAYEALLERQGDIETALLKARCHSAQDFVAKIIAWSGCGVYALPDEKSDAAFWAEARALVMPEAA